MNYKNFANMLSMVDNFVTFGPCLVFHTLD